MQITREEIGGIVCTTIFAILLALLLLLSYFTMASPPEELEGVPVMFGSIEDAFGYVEPPMTEITPIPTQELQIPEYSPNEPLITQTTEPTIDVEALREEERRQTALRSEEHTSELQSRPHLVCRLLLEKK